MNFPFLLWAVANWGPHYKLARAIGCSESRFSRCLYGRSTFTEEERAAIAHVLGLSESWLFEEVTREQLRDQQVGEPAKVVAACP